MALATDSRPLGQRLREDTRELHDRAEKSPFQAKLVQGELPREHYVAGLGQMLLVHRALESKLRDALPIEPRLSAIVTPEQFREQHIEHDLAFFGADASSIAPTEATAAFIASLENATPLTLLGLHYVLEGSNNGNRHIAKIVAEAYSLDESGLSALLPHGSRQPLVWKQFKRDMNEQAFSETEMDEVVSAAKRMFDAVITIHEGLLPSDPA